MSGAFARYEEGTGGMMMNTEGIAKQGNGRRMGEAEVALNQLREENAEEGVVFVRLDAGKRG